MAACERKNTPDIKWSNYVVQHVISYYQQIKRKNSKKNSR